MRSELTNKPPAAYSTLTDVTALASLEQARHRWYFFKEGFSPDIVKKAIDDSDSDPDKGHIVIDPFCGSGTTVLTAAMAGYQAYGVEVNPFMRFVSQTKLETAHLKVFDRNIDAVLKAANHGKSTPLERFSTFSELSPAAKKRKKWLFNSDVLRAFEGAHRKLGNSISGSKKLTKLCLLIAALDASNAYKDGKCLRYRKDWQDLNLGKSHFIDALEKRAKIIRDDLESSNHIDGQAEVANGDSRTHKFKSAFHLCVTSPPYLNSFDYTDVYRPELFLGRFVRSMSELSELRRKTIRSHVQVSWDEPKTNSFGSHYTDAAAKFPKDDSILWDRRIPSMIRAYFEDMAKVLRSLKKKADDQASVWLVVSTSSYLGVEIPVDLIIADIAVMQGWCLRSVNVLRYLKRVSGQQWQALSKNGHEGKPFLRESVVILDAKRRTAQI